MRHEKTFNFEQKINGKWLKIDIHKLYKTLSHVIKFARASSTHKHKKK